MKSCPLTCPNWSRAVRYRIPRESSKTQIAPSPTALIYMNGCPHVVLSNGVTNALYISWRFEGSAALPMTPQNSTVRSVHRQR
jgi:hypothetical protein